MGTQVLLESQIYPQHCYVCLSGVTGCKCQGLSLYVNTFRNDLSVNYESEAIPSSLFLYICFGTVCVVCFMNFTNLTYGCISQNGNHDMIFCFMSSRTQEVSEKCKYKYLRRILVLVCYVCLLMSNYVFLSIFEHTVLESEKSSCTCKIFI